MAVLTYLAASLLLWAHVWFGGNPAHAITCNCGDTVEQVWWLEWFPWALAHGHNPFLTNLLWSRLGGVNALSNTSWMLPAAVLSPVTALFGPVASFNVANLLAPVVSGWAAFVLAGRFSLRSGPRLIAGGLYAFSPFILRNTVLGHIDLTIAAYLPLVLLLGLRLLSSGARPVRIGLWLGLLTILQFFTGEEVMALTAVTGCLCVCGVLIYCPGLLHAARRPLVVAGAVGALVAGAALAYPIWFAMAGPRHVKGPFWPAGSSAPWNVLLAGRNVHNTHTGLTAVGYLGPQGPNVDFLGVGLLLLVIVSFPLWRRRPAACVAAFVGMTAWMLEFGPGHLWAKLPLLSSVELIRFALPVSLFAGLLVAASVDGWWDAIGAHRATRDSRWRTMAARVGLVGLTAVAFVPLVSTYSVPFTVTTATVPAWFTRDAPHLAAGTAVLTVPIAYGLASQPMAWQAETDNGFDLIGGWAFVPGGNGTSDEMMSPIGGAIAALRALSEDPLGISLSQQQAIRTAIRFWAPVDVVLVPALAKPGALTALTSTLGMRPTWVDGAWVWHIGRSTALGPTVALASA